MYDASYLQGDNTTDRPPPPEPQSRPAALYDLPAPSTAHPPYWGEVATTLCFQGTYPSRISFPLRVCAITWSKNDTEQYRDSY
ncbi:hypothetical protein GCM10011498_12040 [Amylibacter cionae]|uniref:Uncharacterized protein n=1 Tax=Neptunicoccus cionae TaxID=2035344 RepID=A0A916QV61_9RHOB|nr:hypothetical protein GCM10011498_12040 [Amylibacter cionae]